MDAPRFARNIETAYRRMWRKLVRGQRFVVITMLDHMSLQELLKNGFSHHQAGRLAEAESIYRHILSQHPDNADALHLLGMVHAQAGRADRAVELIRRAISICPTSAFYYINLGNALMDTGEVDEAIASYRQAIRLKPDYANAHYNLGIALKGKGQLDEAIAVYRRAIALKPAHAEAHCNLGSALKEVGLLNEAVASYRHCIRLKPDFSAAHVGLGNTLNEMGRTEEAIACLRQAIGLNAEDPDAHYCLSIALQANNQLEEAISSYRQAIRLRPNFALAHNNLGNALAEAGELDEAIASHQKAIESAPELAQSHNNLGSTLLVLGQLEAAVAEFSKALELKPDYAAAHSNLLFAMNYDPDIDAQAILAEHQAWSVRHAPPLMGNAMVYRNERVPGRRLRIGYVSADFRRHSISYFLIPLLEHHDRRMFEISCYCSVRNPDDVTERMKSSCDVWRNIAGLSDEAATQLIRSEDIDILVDLSGHTAGNRLGVFARKPAPIQVTYLGYGNTTGMAAIDFRLTDAVVDPSGMTDDLNVERLWRLPMCAWCYQPPEETPEVLPRARETITFGCFNSFAKINHKLLGIWAELLRRIPGSRLLLKSGGAGAASSRQRLLDEFSERGISGGRIEMRGRTSDYREHLKLYDEVDIALDTYPYHGTTTTCEAMWMGVPVVVLAGRSHISRVGLSLLTNVGLPEMIAQTPEDYVQIAAGLAENPPRLDELRRTLRFRMRASPLMDAPRFARNVEMAYREMWRNWCADSGISEFGNRGGGR